MSKVARSSILKTVYLLETGLLLTIAHNLIAELNARTLFINLLGPFSLPISNEIMIVVGLLSLALLSYLLIFNSQQKRAAVGLILIGSGGITLISDRVVLQGIQDYWHVLGVSTNLPDIAILTGALIAITVRQPQV